MRVVRGLLLVAGVGLGLWGVWLMRDFSLDQLVSVGLWLAGAVVLHDAVLAPLTVLIGLGAARALPGPARAPAAIGFLVWATLTLAFANVLSGQGGKPDNDTVLDRPYALSWLVMTGVVVIVATMIAVVRQRSRADEPTS